MKGVMTAALGAVSALVLTASAASAEIVCNREGDCWHVKEHHFYRPEHGVTVYPDNWRWAESGRHRYRWREHEGRGYWRNGVWVEIR
ncbi:MAG TPA: hypothetical protein VE986_05110 [Hyphomicrobiales bacterium]|nr:hypothetical protein [Hyphomicrobiales bacterium]